MSLNQLGVFSLSNGFIHFNPTFGIFQSVEPKFAPKGLSIHLTFEGDAVTSLDYSLSSQRNLYRNTQALSYFRKIRRKPEQMNWREKMEREDREGPL